MMRYQSRTSECFTSKKFQVIGSALNLTQIGNFKGQILCGFTVNILISHACSTGLTYNRDNIALMPVSGENI